MPSLSPTIEPISTCGCTQCINLALLDLPREAAQPLGLSKHDFGRWLPRAQALIARASTSLPSASQPPSSDELSVILRLGPHRAGLPALNVGRGRVTRVPIHDGCNLIVGYAMARETRVARELAALGAGAPAAAAAAREVVRRLGEARARSGSPSAHLEAEVITELIDAVAHLAQALEVGRPVPSRTVPEFVSRLEP